MCHLRRWQLLGVWFIPCRSDARHQLSGIKLSTMRRRRTRGLDYLTSPVFTAAVPPAPAVPELAAVDGLAAETDLAPSAFAPSLWMSTLPLKYAPSSMATRWV